MKTSILLLVVLLAAFNGFFLQTSSNMVSAQGGDCLVTSAGGNVNLRGGPGTIYAIAGQLTPEISQVVTGQILAEDGFVWWRVFTGGWVRSDVSVTSGDCGNIPSVNAPPAYCGGREELAERPILSGDELIFKTERFAIHYTETGVDAATQDYVEAVAEAVEYAWDFQINQLGWPAPPQDCSEGGDESFDVYLKELESESVAGYAVPEYEIGDNLNTPETEIYAAYSHLLVDNDMGGQSNPLGTMRATVAHEFHHNIQLSYDFGDAFGGLDEAGATWMEYHTYPDVDASSFYFNEWMLYPDLCLGSRPEKASQRVYGEALLIDSIVQDFGADSLLTLWRYRADLEGMVTLYDGLEALGTTVDETLLRMAVRNLLFDYEFAHRIPSRVFIENWITGEGTYTPNRDGVQELGFDFLQLVSLQNYTFSIDRPNLTLMLVGIDRNADTATVFELGQSGSVDTRVFTDAYLLLMNTQRHTDEESCSATNWTVTVSTGSTDTASTGEVWNAVNFAPAFVVNGQETYLATIIDKNYPHTYSIGYLAAGDTITISAQALTEGFDPYVLVYAGNFGFGEPQQVAENDDSEGLNSYLEYTAESDGFYTVQVINIGEQGNYQLDLSVNASLIVVPPSTNTDTPPSTLPENVQEYTDSVAEGAEQIVFPPLELNEGDVIYVYAEAISGDLDTLAALDYTSDSPLYDPSAPFLISDDDSGGGLNSKFNFTVSETATYNVILGFLSGSGAYRVVVVVNDEVAFNTAINQ